MNTLSTDNNILQWQGITCAMASQNINALFIQEPNTKWIKVIHKNIQCILQKTFCQATLAMSNSTKPADNTFQPGDTTTAIIGPYTSHMLSHSQDPSSMGQWLYIKLLGKLNKHLIIALVYCIRSQTAKIGSNTVSMQQTQILVQNGQHHPRPWQQCFDDLIKQIHEWQLTHHIILLCLNIKDGTTNPHPEQEYGKFLNHTGLIYLHWYCHPQVTTPATHNCSSLTIDACLGTQLFIDALIGVWILATTICTSRNNTRWPLHARTWFWPWYPFW